MVIFVNTKKVYQIQYQAFFLLFLFLLFGPGSWAVAPVFFYYVMFLCNYIIILLLLYAVKVLYRGRISRCPTTSTLSTPPSWRDTTTGNNQPDPGGRAYLALVGIFEISYF